MTSSVNKRLLKDTHPHLAKRSKVLLPLLTGSPLSEAPVSLNNTKPSATVIYAVVDDRDRSAAARISLAPNVDRIRKPAAATRKYFLAPQLSFGSGNDEFQHSPPSIVSPLTAAPVGRSSAKFVGDYEVLRDADGVNYPSTDKDHREAYIVKEPGDYGNIGFCRRLSFDRYARYVELYQRFNSPPVTNDYCDGDYDETATLERLWPKRTKLFSYRDEASRETRHYLYTPRHFGSLHVHIVDRKKLDVLFALRLYRQIVETVAFCHSRGVVLRDLKLRKFVFADAQHLGVRFFDLDEFHPLVDARDDTIRERNGCPAYVSPEIIDFQSKSYAGKPADVWSMGVLLYVMLVGRYPFYDTTPLGLFNKIRSAQFAVPDRFDVPYELRCALHFMLRREPRERLTASHLLRLPCMRDVDAAPDAADDEDGGPAVSSDPRDSDGDQVVPCVDFIKQPVVLPRSRDQQLNFDV